MYLIHSLFLILPLFDGARAAPKPLAQSPSPPTKPRNPNTPKAYVANGSRAEEIRTEFRWAWNRYKDAPGNKPLADAKQSVKWHDEVVASDGSIYDSRNGWGATPIDALSTAIIMGEKEIVKQILSFIPTIKFGKQMYERNTVSLFETTIRYLGGLLSAYDLIGPGGPKAELAQGMDTTILLTQAKNLADFLEYAFTYVTKPGMAPTGIPNNELRFPGNKTGDFGFQDGPDGIPLAQVGTLILEWTRLADLTGIKKYAALVDKAQSYLLRPSEEIHPGLIPSMLNITTGKLYGGEASWGANADSFYEYLIKMYVYDPKRYGLYKDRWILAADSSISHMSYTSKDANVTFLGHLVKDAKPEMQYNSQHLACFAGGNFILGGTILDRQDYIDFGLRLTDGCHKTYSSTATGIGPELFSFDPKPKLQSAVQKDMFSKAGFYVVDGYGYYNLRPEVVESIYYAYRATGDKTYQDWSWNAFQAIKKKCKVVEGYGYALLNDVTNDKSEIRKGGYQESFFFAETLKYLYMIHAEEADWQVSGPGPNKNQKFVFNTEAHPMKVYSERKNGSHQVF
ncbi:glycoside hydrolase [Microthyrium microscopicum]|uniref:alpha-1,2-Mannosidase n=1 Tax=Microthyrium microscopicum TaxID=703497 RepID=A0A6A6TV91_9PEZI|nr:glycoside hydrolase [Microthyrium microscopicum]